MISFERLAKVGGWDGGGDLEGNNRCARGVFLSLCVRNTVFTKKCVLESISSMVADVFSPPQERGCVEAPPPHTLLLPFPSLPLLPPPGVCEFCKHRESEEGGSGEKASHFRKRRERSAVVFVEGNMMLNSSAPFRFLCVPGFFFPPAAEKFCVNGGDSGGGVRCSQGFRSSAPSFLPSREGCAQGSEKTGVSQRFARGWLLPHKRRDGGKRGWGGS